MVKIKEIISCHKADQKRFSQRIMEIKKKLQDGDIKIRENKKENKLKAEETRGLVYVGHIPHGFYEDEMKKYFKQFGEVTNTTVCRSGKTGKSKGYGFVEFKNPEVAKIVADTMDNYIMFKKRLVVEYIPPQKRPKKLFCGKGNTEINYSAKRRRLKQMINKNKPLTESEVVQKAQATIKKLSKKMQKLQKSGVTCDVEPVNVPDNIKKEKESVINLVKSGQVISDESVVEVKPPKRHSKRKVASKKSYIDLEDGHRVLLKKSIDSVKTLLSKPEVNISKSEDTKTLLAGTSVKKVQKKKKNAKSRGIKKKSMLAPLNKDCVKQIARELIRKRGTPLLNLIPPSKIK